MPVDPVSKKKYSMVRLRGLDGKTWGIFIDENGEISKKLLV
jgi:hypothetical protein